MCTQNRLNLKQTNTLKNNILKKIKTTIIEGMAISEWATFNTSACDIVEVIFIIIIINI